MALHRAVKEESRLRMGLVGPSGSGKTFSALRIGIELAKLFGGRVALLDSERGSAAKYADIFDFDMDIIFDDQSPDAYTKAIQGIDPKTHPVIVIDSLSHAWMGKKGSLELVDLFASRSQSGNSFAAWRNVTPKHNAMVDAILASPSHIIACLRAKSEYVMEKDEKTGKTVPRKIGMAPIMRDGIEYEFDICGDITLDHKFIVSKSRCHALTDAAVEKPGEEFARELHKWLTVGVQAMAPAAKGKPWPEEQAAKAQPPATATQPADVQVEVLVDAQAGTVEAKQSDNPAPVPNGNEVTAEEVIKCLTEYQQVNKISDARQVRETCIQPLGCLSFQDVPKDKYPKVLKLLWEKGYNKAKSDELPPVFQSIFRRLVAAKK